MKDLHEANLFDSLRERLGRYEEAPSEELWGKIAAAQKRKRRAVWPALVGVVSVVGIGAAMIFGSGEKKELKDAVKEVVVEAPAGTTENRTEVKDNLITKPSIVAAQAKVAQTHFESQTTEHGSPITNYKSETIPDSVSASPIVIKKDSSKSIDEVIPPYKKPKSKFQLYFSVTPSLSFQKIIPGGHDDIIIQGLANRSPFSMKRFGFALDAGVQYDLNRFFGFYGGISFYRQQQQLTYYYYDRDAEVTRVGDSWTFAIDRPQHSKTFDYTMTNIGARTGLLITLKGEKLKHKFGAGIAYSHGFAKAADSYNNSQSSYIAYQVFYRNEIKINDHFSWFVEPTFNYSFISKEKLAEPFSLKPYRAGITGGVLYRFR